MQIRQGIHAIKVSFQIPVSQDLFLDRFVYVYILDFGKLSIIDSGVAGAESDIERKLSALGKQLTDIEYLFLTHAHPDHIGAAKVVKTKSNCSIWAHPSAQSWVEDVDKQFAERPVPGFHALVDGSFPVTHIYGDKEVIDLGDEQVRIVYTPGHSKCSVSLFCEKSGVLFTGDAIPQGNDLPIYDDVKAAVESIHQLKKIEGVECLLSSWREPSLADNPQKVLDQGLHYFQKIHSVVREVAQKNGKNDPMSLCRTVVDLLQLPKLAVNPIVAKSLCSHLPLLDNDLL